MKELIEQINITKSLYVVARLDDIEEIKEYEFIVTDNINNIFLKQFDFIACIISMLPNKSYISNIYDYKEELQTKEEVVQYLTKHYI